MEVGVANQEVEVTIRISRMKLADLLSEAVKLDTKKKTLEKEVEAVGEQLTLIKDRLKNEFVELGVKSMKGAGKTIYLSKQIWAGAAEGQTNSDVSKALQSLNLDAFVTFNHQSLSGYVRELAKEHSEWYDSDGDLVVESAEILKALPKPLDQMLKITDKIDIKIRK